MDRRSVLFGLCSAAVVPASVSAEAIFQSEQENVPYKFRRREVDFGGQYPPGTIVVDTKKRYLYFVLGGGRAMRYGVGVGKDGFEWSGEAVIGRKAKWPRWTPTKEAIERSSGPKEWHKGVEGGLRSPLGARALYLYQDGVDTFYRIHGTTRPKSIGTAVSTGCIRMLNYDVADLYERAAIGTRVIVLQKGLND